MSDEYACVSKSKLKLKNDSGIKKKKKKRKEKDKSKDQDLLQESFESERIQISSNEQRQLTKAEKAFKQQQEKMVRKIFIYKIIQCLSIYFSFAAQ